MKQLIALCGIIASTTTFAAPQPPMQEGLWEITSHTEIPGSSARAQPVTSRACYTKQDVASENPAAPKDDTCEIHDYQSRGNTADWSIACAGKGNIIGRGSVTFHDKTTYSGTVTLRIRTEGQPEIQMRNNYSAKRISDCNNQ